MHAYNPMMRLLMFFCGARKSAYFGKIELPEAQELGIYNLFQEEADLNGPGPWEGLPDPKIEVSDQPNRKFNLKMLVLRTKIAPRRSEI
mgnify:CR=1 FL=1